MFNLSLCFVCCPENGMKIQKDLAALVRLFCGHQRLHILLSIELKPSFFFYELDKFVLIVHVIKLVFKFGKALFEGVTQSILQSIHLVDCVVLFFFWRFGERLLYWIILFFNLIQDFVEVCILTLATSRRHSHSFHLDITHIAIRFLFN